MLSYDTGHIYSSNDKEITIMDTRYLTEALTHAMLHYYSVAIKLLSVALDRRPSLILGIS